MELKLGKMSTKELAEWFGISYNTLIKNKESRMKYLVKLEDFAEFEEIYGGVVIKEIYIAIYDKELNVKMDNLYLEEIKQCEGGLSTVAGMARKYSKETNLTERQLGYRLTKSGNKLFGKYEKGSSTAVGTEGYRQYLWAVKVNDDNVYRLLTEEERVRFDELVTEVYGLVEPEMLKQAALLEEEFKNSDMTKEQYLDAREKKGFNFFSHVLKRLKDELDIVVTKVSQHQLSAL